MIYFSDFGERGSFIFGGETRLSLNVAASTWGTAFTLCAWVNVTAAGIAGGNHDIMSLANSSGDSVGVGNQRRTLNIQSTNKQIRAAESQTTSSAIASSLDTTDWVQDTWFHAAAVFSTSTSRAAFLNGAAKGTNADSRSPTTPNRVHIGFSYFSGGTGGFNIGHAAIWKRTLTDGEIATLATGVRPDTIQASDLVFYADLLNGVAIDRISGNTLTNVGAVFDPTKTPPVS